jgi:hypothetical protein
MGPSFINRLTARLLREFYEASAPWLPARNRQIHDP